MSAPPEAIKIWWHEKTNTLDIVQPDGIIITFLDEDTGWKRLGLEGWDRNEVHGWALIGEL